MNKRRIKDIERLCYRIDMLSEWNRERLLIRQFPKRVRPELFMECRWWEGVPWVAVHRVDQAHDDASIHVELLASAPMLNVTKRYGNAFVGYAVIDPELIAYVLLLL